MDFFDFFVSLFIYRQIFVDTSTSFCRYCHCCRKKISFFCQAKRYQAARILLIAQKRACFPRVHASNYTRFFINIFVFYSIISLISSRISVMPPTTSALHDSCRVVIPFSMQIRRRFSWFFSLATAFFTASFIYIIS